LARAAKNRSSCPRGAVKMNNLSKFAWTATPLFLILVCSGLYIVFDLKFLRGCDTDAIESLKTNTNINNKTPQSAKGCSEAIDADMISSVRNAEAHDESKKRLITLNENSSLISNRLANQTERHANLLANLNEATEDFSNLNTALANYNASNSLNVYPSVNINANANAGFNANVANANLTRLGIIKTHLNEQLTQVNTNITRLNTELTENGNTVLAIRQQYGGRYSYRMLWIFLTALFLALSVFAIAVSAHVIFKCSRIFIGGPRNFSIKNSVEYLKSIATVKSIPIDARDSDIKRADNRTFWWIAGTAMFAVAYSIIVFIFNEEFMSVARPMFEPTIKDVEKISMETLVFFVICGFVGAIFLTAASFAVFRAAVKVDETVPEKMVEKELPADLKVFEKVVLGDNPPIFKEVSEYDEITPATNPPTYRLKSKGTNPVEDKDAKLEIYARLLKHLRTILYVGTFMLVIGILRMTFMMDWHLTFISTNTDNKLVELLKAFGQKSMTVQGGFYTILLAAIYLPAAYWISGRIARLGLDKNKLDAQGVTFKYTDLIFKLLAIVSPLLTASFGANTNWLTSLFGS
jgi:hypothetical protein